MAVNATNADVKEVIKRMCNGAAESLYTQWINICDAVGNIQIIFPFLYEALACLSISVMIYP